MQESDLWFVFIAIVAILLVADLVMNRKAHHIPMRTALAQTSVWIGAAIAFGVLLFFVTGNSTLTMEYFTAYAIEESMSMDNLFVFIIIFAYFGIRDEDQHKALFYGVVGAIVFRAIFIFAGVELLNMFDWLLYVFGAILLIIAIKTLIEKSDNNKENKIAKFMKNRFDYVDDEEANGKLFVKRNGKRVVTAIFLCILVIELTDVVFALDSIPAVLAISTDTMVIYTSNIFAVMGLRSLFFVIKGGMNSLAYLKYGLGAILLFVSMKLLLHEFVHIPIALSLGVIVGILLITIVASLLKSRKDKAAQA
ncbi:TerC/Alx family metal homeostasis membrane protein [Candidatus Methanoprimaticola sp. MG2]|uniref:TerC/Alx family metal homeostasis membrane protein n=1 Tax=Candidatus Methanoprimaticola sp. MG2 TaxID=3228838 RepID=UPI0039C6AFDD